MDVKGLYKYAGHFTKDTRGLCPGDVYIALAGDKYDGHDFVGDAFRKGADYAVVSRDIECIQPQRLVIVPDPLKALEEIARHVRNTSGATVVGLTGSSGKTSTKELIKAALQGQGGVHATVGNLNNHIGLPLMLANMPQETDVAVLEMGMNHAGELSHLTEIARPHIAIVTNVGTAHQEFFVAPDGIARAKSEIFEGLEEGGHAIINSDGGFSSLLVQAAEKRGGRIVTFGRGADSDLRLISYGDGAVTASVFGREYSYRLRLLGEHQALNSLIALGVVTLLGKDVSQAIGHIEALEPLKGRGATYGAEINSVPFLLIDESYNANPDSMKAAIRVLGSFKGRRKIAVIGDMLELGDRAVPLHVSLKPCLMEAGVDKVYAVGETMQHLFRELPMEMQGAWVLTSRDLLPILNGAIRRDDVVFVKGSLGSNMILIIDYLQRKAGG